MTDFEIPLYGPRIGPAETEAVVSVLKSGWLSAGPVTEDFEGKYAAALGVESAVAVSSGTAALHLAVLALGLGPGDEVVLPSLNFVSAAAAVALSGATPVFADVTGPHDLCLDPADAARRITSRTRAVVAMHYGGHAADLTALGRLARAHGIALIEDCAHAPVTDSAHGMLGTVGDIGCYSFFATKNLAMGEGGMVVARDPAVADRIRRLRSHALTVSAQQRHGGGPAGYDVDALGLNYRPTEIGCAVGRVQLESLPAAQARRQDAVRGYRRRLAALPGLVVPFVGRPVEDGAHHLLAVVLPEHVDREALRDRLRAAGIQTGVHYPPTHLFTAYRRRCVGGPDRLPVTEDVMARQLSLPLHPGIGTAEVLRVTEAMSAAWREAR
ncbi:DegT/DnrJ/EryC1/StrS aminotransferase family protein [Streptomyces niveiscabiei]|uniref:DegT/DnrJ/EryC1/StrS family aminotransferase n=1 Tax=Streptomyces niveiscabiei TaxID=164115 RepID=UPI0029A5037D|nr:DegT/DnrJ/EryC1/StrS aminotransferase family protein [Streptomyces niveiscabiei]MDX3382459.1 DegT/DnrJ/EryC1/StrS aminotransferase family protein [Streptomyces niveiscabiei]